MTETSSPQLTGEFRTVSTLQELIEYANCYDWILSYTYEEFKNHIYCFITPTGCRIQVTIRPKDKVSL